MGRRRDTREKVEFGDFQTPDELAVAVCRLLATSGTSPASIIEPTCGVGSLLVAAIDAFAARTALGIDINAAYVQALRDRLGERAGVEATQGDFFTLDWDATFARLPEPILCIGNPPWVTSSDLGQLASKNVPEKSNFHGRAGLDALTGKSNFDISEWMLIKLLAALDGRAATVAMLCKTSVARKALSFGWNAGYRITSAATYRIDAAKHFGAAVDACLLVCTLGAEATTRCAAYESLTSTRPNATLGYQDGQLVADVVRYERWKHLLGESPYKWRSGVKHDCAAVMELRKFGALYQNGDGTPVELEDDFVYPMLKSSEVARAGAVRPARFMLVTQRHVGEDTARIAEQAPRTWRYLAAHRARFDKRASSIYRGKPPFSIFGIGEYTFAPWKVAISGLYKKLDFRVVGPVEGKPVVLDDTCYFLPCATEEEAQLLASLLASEPAQELYGAFVFWDAKRPITTELLRRLDLWRLAEVLGRGAEYQRVCVLRAVA